MNRFSISEAPADRHDWPTATSLVFMILSSVLWCVIHSHPQQDNTAYIDYTNTSWSSIRERISDYCYIVVNLEFYADMLSKG